MKRPRIQILLLAFASLLALPCSARASDTTGAFLYVFGLGLIGCLVLGIALALVLKFVFKLGHWVWVLIPITPVLGFAGLILAARLEAGPGSKRYHEGPDIEFGGSHSMTVSPEFGKAGLIRAMKIINQPEFKAGLAQYTDEPMSNYVFALDLESPSNPQARHFVSICVKPTVSVNTPTYEAIMFLFSKAVIEADPHPCDHPYTEPKKIR